MSGCASRAVICNFPRPCVVSVLCPSRRTLKQNLMATDTAPQHKPAPLANQILHAERRLLERRRSIIACATRLRGAARAQAASPAMLAGAAGLGFALERMTGRKPADAEPAGHAS